MQRAAAQEVEQDLLARRRVFPQIGPGIQAIKRDSAGRYYILTAPGAAVGVFNAAGERVAQIPASPAKDDSITYGEDFDLDSAGKLYVADRGANAVRVFDPQGQPGSLLRVPAPTSVVALSGGGIAVASLKSRHLVNLYDDDGKLVREFGDLSDLAQRPELNRFLNIGRLAKDSAGHLYYAFTYLPEPTVRKYDRYGYVRLEISLATLEFQPAAQAERREIWRQGQRRGAPDVKGVINAIAVDPQTQEIWVALGDQLLHFDRDGTRHASYRTLTPDGARLQACAVLVEPHRLLLADDPLGIFEYARPHKAGVESPHE